MSMYNKHNTRVYKCAHTYLYIYIYVLIYIYIYTYILTYYIMYIHMCIYMCIYHCIYSSFQGLAGQGCGHCLQSNVPLSSPLHKSPQTRKHQISDARCKGRFIRCQVIGCAWQSSTDRGQGCIVFVFAIG